MKKFTEAIKESVLVFDGSKGYMLQKEGLSGGKSAESWNITKSDTVRALYQKYKDSGSDVIQTNTFQGTEHHLKQHGLSGHVYQVNFTAATDAKKVMGQDGFVAASVGPIGKMMTPSGDLGFEEAYQLFKEQMIPLVEGGVDAVNFETFTDVAELRAAVLALKDVKSDIPVIASVAFEENKRTLMGTSPYNAALILKSLGCEVIGTNCSFGPSHMLDVVKEMSQVGGPLSVKPNAGIPRLEEGHAVYDQSPSDFAKLCEEFIPYGAVLIGGCCGTTPLFVSELKNSLKGVKPVIPEYRETGEISSLNFVFRINEYEKCNKVVIDVDNPNNRSAFESEDLFDLMSVAMDARDENPDFIVFQGGEDLDQGKISRCFDIIQGYANIPFVFHVKNKENLESLLRIYRGRGGVLSDPQEELMNVARKYGALIIEP